MILSRVSVEHSMREKAGGGKNNSEESKNHFIIAPLSSFAEQYEMIATYSIE